MPLGGRLVLKGQPVKDKKKKKKRSRDDAEEKPYDGKTTEGKEEERDEPEEPAKTPDPEAGLTEAQKRHLAKLRQREAERIKKIVGQTHRERVEEFNNYLASLTEHNDIPRVSAAGNG